MGTHDSFIIYILWLHWGDSLASNVRLNSVQSLTCIVSCSQHVLDNYIQTDCSYALINLSPNLWSRHQFIFDSKGGLQPRHTAIGAVHFHSSLFSSHVWKAIRTKHHHIWGNYKSQWWPRIDTAHETSSMLQKYYLALACCISLNSSQHYNMWILALIKAWQAAWMAVPAVPPDPDELERRQVLECKQHRVKTQARPRNWRTVKKAANPLISRLLPMLRINHVVKRTWWLLCQAKC